MEAVRKKTRNRKTRAVQQAESKVENIDFKMVTFTLAGKDYGIDIMKVKEIAKFINFTYVPNTPPFVRGVYNLRGEIISIIDLREMFNLPLEEEVNTTEENGLILRLENNMIGVVVDKIDKVVGISSDSIQPPHPIFGDINIKYINGVVENEGRLYIILDVERILGGENEEKEDNHQSKKMASLSAKLQEQISTQPETEDEVPDAEAKPQSTAGAKNDGTDAKKESAADKDDVNKQFIAETLEAFQNFHVSEINSNWFQSRFSEWKSERKSKDLQLEHQADADLFTSTFTSLHSGRLWEADLFDSLFAALPQDVDSQLHIWNPGCGKGYETYSMAVLFKKKYPSARIKIWASDKDLLSVSSAPNLIFQDREIPEQYKEFMVEGPNGYSFNQEIKDAILFEYHDIVNAHSMPPIQLLVARDLLSYLQPDLSTKFFQQLDERLKPGGIVILGDNEEIPPSYGWDAVTKSKLRFYIKK